MQPLLEVIGNPRREAADTRRRAEYQARERERQEQLRREAEWQKAEREARRPVAPAAARSSPTSGGRRSSPPRMDAPWGTYRHLREACKQQAHATEQQAGQSALDQQMLGQAVPESRAGGGWFSRFRPGSG